MQLGHLTYDATREALTGPAGTVDLRPKTLKVLSVLAANAGSVVTKDMLLTEAWAGLSVTDDSLTQCIAEIRRALGKEARSVLRTVHGRGYRLEAGAMVTPVASKSPIRFARNGDVQLAWTQLGHGIDILKAPTWVSNIEEECEGPVFGPFYAALADRARITLFDQRGTSLSTREPEEWTVGAMVEDMKAVADAAGLGKMVLFGPSQGAAFSVAFAATYPERVRAIICRGAFAEGWLVTGGHDMEAKYLASRAVIEAGWGDTNPEYRRFFTARLMPDATPELARAFDDLQDRAIGPDAQLKNLELMCRLDVRDLLGKVTCPVLLLHARGDRAVSLNACIRMAAALPDAELRVFECDNHVPVPGSQSFPAFVGAIRSFLDALEA